MISPHTNGRIVLHQINKRHTDSQQTPTPKRAGEKLAKRCDAPIGMGVKIATVIPIARGVGKETLTYFTMRDVKEGMLVSIPLRSKKAPALVLAVHEATHDKTELKAADFKLKKIGEIKGYVLSPSFVRAAEKTARYFAARTGAALEALVPDAILEGPPTMRINVNSSIEAAATILKPAFAKISAETKHEKLLLQADDEEREAIYKSLIREEFAKKHSVFLCLPTIHDRERVESVFSRGIEKHVFVFHSELGKKELLSRWKKALKHSHPALIIGTGIFLSLPRDDIETIIIEKEHSNAYKMRYRPFIDIRTFAELYMRERGGKLIVADLKLRTETLYKRDQREYAEFAPFKFRAPSRAKSILVNMKEDNKDPVSGKNLFTPIGGELMALLRDVAAKGGRLFAFVPRRGLFPVTVCNDCGALVLCERCRTPLVLHRVDSRRSTVEVKNIFMCHSCRRETASRDRCDSCGSWRLAPLGAGTEFAEEIIKEKFPSLRTFRLDKETGSTRKKAAEIVEEFYQTLGSVLVGTESAVSFLRRIPHTAVISCDSFFVIPDFRMNERVFAMLLALRAKTEKTFLLQTRMPHIPVFKEALRGDISNFYREELRVRKEFGYPPFTTLVKLSVSGSAEKAAAEVARLETLLAAYHPISFPARKENPRGGVLFRILLKVAGAWPNDVLVDILSSLSPAIEVRVDPEDTL